jgi:prepilin-type N-terminal cleavage/methylation domain-containing protein
MRTHKRGFTLIELLVVIAIIAILAAILFPVFAQAKLAAKKTVALSNAKEIALGVIMYQNDYDDAVPCAYFGAPPQCANPVGNWGGVPPSYLFDWYSWRHAIYSYLSKSGGLLQDPTNQFSQPQYDIDSPAIAGSPDDYALSTNFAANAAIMGFANAGCWNSANENAGLLTLDSVPNVADTIMLAPSRTNYINTKWMFGNNYGEAGKFNSLSVSNGSQVPAPAWCDYTIAAPLVPICPASGFGPFNSVNGQISFVWCDGHAKSRTYVSTLETTNATGDGWFSQNQPNDDNSTPTQADRVWVSQHLFTEYQ